MHAKLLVQASFNRAATRYDAAAVVQKEVCAELMAGLNRYAIAKPAQILDAGCGTGFGSSLLQLHWPESEITLLDFAPAMLQHAQHSGQKPCVADMEALPFANTSFNLWWSSLAIQWCNNQQVFYEAHRVLRPGGLLAVSTVGADTFKELRQAFTAVDNYQHTLSFTSQDKLYNDLQQQSFKNIEIQRKTFTQYYSNLKNLLNAVKAVGANQVTSGGRSSLMGRTSWKNLETAFEELRTPQGLPLSYDVLMAYATTGTYKRETKA